MNDLSHTLRKFNRFELKYLITLQQAEQVKSVLDNYLVHDWYGKENGRYRMSSLYYDSPEFRCYWEKEYGLRVRRKLRIRQYGSGEVMTEETPVFVEIKQRVDRVTQKRRALLPYGDALKLCNDRQIPEHAPEDRATIEEIFAFLWQYNLRPASVVRYERQAYVGSEYDLGLRVTFDTDLTFQTYPLQLHEYPSGLPMMQANRVVMEIKVNERIPYWLTELIAAQNLQMVRISKYCRSIELAKNMPSFHFRNHTADSARETLSSSLSIFNSLEEKIRVRKQH